MDEAWIKNLASVHFENGQMVVPLGEQYSGFIESRIRESMQNIYDLCHAYAAAYNTFKRDGKMINCMPLPVDGQRGDGVMILLGKRQIRLAPAKGVFVAEGVSVEAFVRRGGFRWVFRPHTDVCGSVVWSQDQKLLMESDLLVKKLFETLVQWDADASTVKPQHATKESFYEG